MAGEMPVPEFLTGEFVDDYGIRYSISREHWLQHPDARYELVEWRPGSQMALARSESANRGREKGWLRIDWLRLEDGGEYAWAYCYAAYDAPTREAAVAASPSQRETPRVGCNGFPFSRMRPITRSER
jgi:hypothetical protein